MAGAGYNLFVAGQKLTAAQVNTYLMQQALMQFATNSARDTALSAVLDEGLVTTQADTDEVTIYNGSAWVPIADYGAWTTYTPQLDQGASTNISKTVAYAGYVKWGRMVTVSFRLDVTGAGTSGSAIAVSLPPFTPVYTTNLFAGSGIVSDASIPQLIGGAAVITSTTRVQIWRVDGQSPTNAPAGVSPAFALANGDAVIASFTFEATA